MNPDVETPVDTFYSLNIVAGNSTRKAISCNKVLESGRQGQLSLASWSNNPFTALSPKLTAAQNECSRGQD